MPETKDYSSVRIPTKGGAAMVPLSALVFILAAVLWFGKELLSFAVKPNGDATPVVEVLDGVKTTLEMQTTQMIEQTNLLRTMRDNALIDRTKREAHFQNDKDRDRALKARRNETPGPRFTPAC